MMKSEIRNIRYLAKGGAFGRTDATGFYIYGTRRDGKTVPCKHRIEDDGSIVIFSVYWVGDSDMEEDVTELTAKEWDCVRAANGAAAVRICNQILDARR